MKTLADGTPQFDEPGHPHEYVYGSGQINQQLREWSAERKCVRCKHFYIDTNYTNFGNTCEKLGLLYKDEGYSPEVFSCAAWEKK